MRTDAAALPRSGPAVREWLQRHAPDEVARFDHDFSEALREAGASFDLAVVEGVVTRWWGLTWARLQQLTSEEQDLLDRFDRGEVAGLLAQASDGSFHRL